MRFQRPAADDPEPLAPHPARADEAREHVEERAEVHHREPREDHAVHVRRPDAAERQPRDRRRTPRARRTPSRARARTGRRPSARRSTRGSSASRRRRGTEGAPRRRVRPCAGGSRTARWGARLRHRRPDPTTAAARRAADDKCVMGLSFRASSACRFARRDDADPRHRGRAPDPRLRPARARGSRASWWTPRRTAPPGSARARTRHYDLVVLDLLLPGLDGLTVLRELARTEPDAARRHPLRARRPADEAARLRARRARLRREAVRARRAARAGARAAARGRRGRRTTSRCCASAALELDVARRRARVGDARRRSHRPRVPAAAPPRRALRARSSAASSCSRRCGATTSIPARTSSTSASGGCGKKLGADAPIETVRHVGYRLAAA